MKKEVKIPYLKCPGAKVPIQSDTCGTLAVTLARALKVFFKVALENYGCYILAALYTIEFQKRGVPRCHTLLWVDNKDKVQDSRDVDRYISTELPDPKIDQEGYRIVSEMMVMGSLRPG
ncbi:hypothetical protein OSB04_016161 [Centaurea solstitialis]|uniref:Helitron helicase-like domain-containing protein n=1 Tax=Centaurea solstitialis TaxID=347529 RepID=A0AA38TBH2_9ASTR|nr:hypothetical protein OSB04_016161 [Centaurea solstitialis]